MGTVRHAALKMRLTKMDPIEVNWLCIITCGPFSSFFIAISLS